MSHPSLTRQAVRYVYVTPVTHTAGGALRICHRHSHRRRCVTYMSPSLTRQAVRYVYVTPVNHTAGGALRICHTCHSHGRQCGTYMSHPSPAFVPHFLEPRLILPLMIARSTRTCHHILTFKSVPIDLLTILVCIEHSPRCYLPTVLTV
jgi:hypothetical protein